MTKPIETCDALIAYCRHNDRVCPQPQLWQQLWEKLPNRKQIGVGWEPSLPLILAAWHDTPAMLKMLRLAEHIEWADRHNKLQEIASFLRELPEESWHHIGD
ncbi:MAG: hypothetical protein HY242_06055 [Afipia sp.]|nr:hypothetical protein [Afipia sp.]